MLLLEMSPNASPLLWSVSIVSIQSIANSLRLSGGRSGGSDETARRCHQAAFSRYLSWSSIRMVLPATVTVNQHPGEALSIENPVMPVLSPHHSIGQANLDVSVAVSLGLTQSLTSSSL